MTPNPAATQPTRWQMIPSLEGEQGGLLHSSARQGSPEGFQQHESTLVSQRLPRKMSPPRGTL